MRIFLGSALAGLFLLHGVGAFAGSPDVPPRFKDIAQTKLTKLVAILGTPEIEPAMPKTAAFSPDGKYAVFATGGFHPFGGGAEDPASVTLWNVDKSTIEREIKIPKAGISSLALLPDARHVVLVLQMPFANQPNEMFRLALWDLHTGKEKRAFAGHKQHIQCVAASADGKWGLSGGIGEVKLWNLDTGKEAEVKLAGHGNNGVVMDVHFAPDARFAVTAGQDNNVVVWDLKTGKARHTLAHPNGVGAVAVSKDGKHLATLDFTPTIKIWDLANGKELKAIQRKSPNPPGIVTLTLSPDGGRILAIMAEFDPTGTKETISLAAWDANTGKELWAQPINLNGVAPIHYEKGLVGGGSNAFMQWDFDKGKLVRIWGGHKAPISSVAHLRDGRIVSASLEGQLVVWDKNEPRTVANHTGGIHAFAFTPDERLVLTAGADKRLKLWELTTGKEVHAFSGHKEQLTSVAVSPDGRYAVSASADRTLKIWDLQSKKDADTLIGHGDAVNAVAISPDGKWIASASDDNTLRLWPIRDGKLAGESRRLDGHKRQVMCLAFAPDGKHILSGSQDMTLKLWDAAEGKAITTLEGHKNWVNCVAFRDDRTAVSSSDDLTVRVWDLQTGKELDQIDMGKSTDVARCVALSGDSMTIGTAGWCVLRYQWVRK